MAPDLHVGNLPWATARGENAQRVAALDYLERKLTEQLPSQPPAQAIPVRENAGHGAAPD